MELTDKITISQDVVARLVGKEMVILHLASGTYFGLDDVGARMWELMAEGKALAEVCDLMLNEYQVSRLDLERDALALAEELEAKGLVSAK